MIRLVYTDSFPPFGELTLRFLAVPDKPADLAEVHLFTGTNGTGKTRILSLLAALLGNDQPLRSRWPFYLRVMASNKQGHESRPFDTWPVEYSMARNVAANGENNFRDWLNQIPAFAYGGGAYIADAPVVVLASISKPQRAECLAFARTAESSQSVLQAITNLKIQAALEYNERAFGTPDAALKLGRSAQIISALETALTEITGLPFSFRVRTHPSIITTVSWGKADAISFSALPDGLRQIIGWLVHAVVMTDVWLEGAGTPMQAEAVFLIDEIESHLHPAWQRKILPAFQRMFPQAQIFVSTHSPFVIASLNVGWIHRLTMQDKGEVTVHAPQPASSGDSYVTVVEDIMGVREWYDPETEQLLASFRALRDAAYKQPETLAVVKAAGAKIAERSMELELIITSELAQLERQLKKQGLLL